MTTVGIIGASGYTGIELVRILGCHPSVTIAYATSRTHAGKRISTLAPDLRGICDIELIEIPPTETVDVVFLAVPHGAARQVLNQHRHLHHSLIIDLSSDHRAHREWTYGLPELYSEQIRRARRIANPGCFATALLLALLPLAQSNRLPHSIYASGITGSTGAGADLSPTLHFSWRHANVQAYNILNHRHVREVLAALGTPAQLHFVPYRGPFTRGIIVTVVIDWQFGYDQLTTLYHDFYRSHRLVQVSDESPDLKSVVGSARATVHCTSHDSTAAIVCVLDNLLKGAAAQAVQNMNLALGLPECTGLPLRAIGW